MKKLFFGLVATLFMGSFVNANTTTFVEKSVTTEETTFSDERVKVTVYIKWGRVSRKCEGFGICEMDITLEVDIELPFQLTILDGGKLQLETNSVGYSNIVKQFGTGSIILEENYVLKPEVCRSLGIPTGYTIKTGKYAMVKNSTGGYSTVL